MADRLEPLLNFHPFTRLNALLEGDQAGRAGDGPVGGRAPGGTPRLPGRDPGAPEGGLVALSADRRHAGFPRRRRRLAEPALIACPPASSTAIPTSCPAPAAARRCSMLALAAVPEWQGTGRAARRADAQPLLSLSMPGRRRWPGPSPSSCRRPAPTASCPSPMPMPGAVLPRTALAYVCSPSNPQGAVASRDYLARWLALGRRHDYTVAFDECYAEIYRGQPPAGALEVAEGVSTTCSCCIPSPSAPPRRACARASSPATVG